jgi:hypothetical protein
VVLFSSLVEVFQILRVAINGAIGGAHLTPDSEGSWSPAGIFLVFAVCGSIFGTPAGWTATQDMNKACQIAFPSTWTVTPEGQVDRLIENSAGRIRRESTNP